MKTLGNKQYFKIRLLTVLLLIIPFAGSANWQEEIEDFCEDNDIPYSEYDSFDDFMNSADDDTVDDYWDGISYNHDEDGNIEGSIDDIEITAPYPDDSEWDDYSGEECNDPCECWGECEEGYAPPVNTGSGTVSVTPPAVPGAKAKTIFRNSNMIDKNWEVLERMLDKIIANCMGRELYNEIVGKLKGKTVTIQFNTGNNSSFNFRTGGVSLSMNMESSSLLHEMFHIYQSYGETQTTFAASTMNQEFEAWYAKYLYVSKLPEYQVPGNKWARQFNDTKYGKSVRKLDRHISADGTFITGEPALFNHIWSVMQPTFSDIGYDSYESDYDRTGRYNFRNLTNLLQACP